MPISLDRIRLGSKYSRKELAKIWGYASYHAIARGVVTPQDDSKIILFVTEEKQASSEPYADRLVNETLYWEGPNDHFAERRMLEAEKTGEQIYLFYRERHHTNFIYMGRVHVQDCTTFTDRPSKFVLRVIGK